MVGEFHIIHCEVLRVSRFPLNPIKFHVKSPIVKNTKLQSNGMYMVILVTSQLLWIYGFGTACWPQIPEKDVQFAVSHLHEIPYPITLNFHWRL